MRNLLEHINQHFKPVSVHLRLCTSAYNEVRPNEELNLVLEALINLFNKLHIDSVPLDFHSLSNECHCPSSCMQVVARTMHSIRLHHVVEV